MLPYQAVAMDYAVASAGFHHHQRPGGLPGVMGLPGPGSGLNPGLNPAFTHSWFVQTSPDICRQQQASNQSHLEPGHVSFFLLYFYLIVTFVLPNDLLACSFYYLKTLITVSYLETLTSCYERPIVVLLSIVLILFAFLFNFACASMSFL